MEKGSDTTYTRSHDVLADNHYDLWKACKGSMCIKWAKQIGKDK